MKMIGYVLTAGSGLKFENGQVSGLSEASEERAKTAADLYLGQYYNPQVPIPGTLADDSEFHFAGAYPRLPNGVSYVPPELREGSLMQKRAVGLGVPEEITRVELDSTSTIKNVINTIRNITDVNNPDKRDIARFINPNRQIGVIAGESHLPRIQSALIKAGCMRYAIRMIPTAEAPRKQDSISMLAHKAGMLVVPRNNLVMLDRVDSGLEFFNDRLHGIAGTLKGFKSFTTNKRSKVVS